jgi:hypothetical protein
MKKNKILNLVMLLCLLGGCSFCLFFVNKYRAENRQLEHNINALSDTIRVKQDRYDNFYYEKLAVVSDIKGLEQLNKELFEKIKALPKSTQKMLIMGSDLNIMAENVSKDTLIVLYSDTSFVWRFADSLLLSEMRVLIGNNKLQLSDFSYQIGLPLETYITDELSVIVKSPLPQVSVSKLNSFINPSIAKKMKRKRWSAGLQAGVGVAAGYGLFSKRADALVGAYVGIGITYKFFEW